MKKKDLLLVIKALSDQVNELDAAAESMPKDKRKAYPTGTNAELRNTIARLQKRLKQVTEFHEMDDGHIVAKDDVIERLRAQLNKQQEQNGRLFAKIEELERKIAAPAADVTGYEDAFIDGYKYAWSGKQTYVTDEYQLRSVYHDRAVQRAVFPDVINSETYSMRIVATGALTKDDNNDAI